MRYFRIPNFTGIEAHRDDADRGSLRVVEGCLPQGPGGVSSGPVWKKVGDVDSTLLSTDKNLAVTSSADKNGNSFIFASRHSEVHDIHFMPEPNTVLGELEDDVEVSYTLKLLSYATLYSKITDEVSINITDGVPLKITYMLENSNSNLNLYLAPKIND